MHYVCDVAYTPIIT